MVTRLVVILLQSPLPHPINTIMKATEASALQCTPPKMQVQIPGLPPSDLGQEASSTDSPTPISLYVEDEEK